MRTAVCVPAYNAERHLAETVRSVVAQTLADWELIIVDGASTDGTADVARQLAAGDTRIRVVRQANNGGSASHTRNAALAEVSAGVEFVLFLDADDLLLPNALEALVASLDAHPEAPAAQGLLRSVNGLGEPCPGPDEAWCLYPRERMARVVGAIPADLTPFAVLAYRCNITTPGVVLIRRSALTRVGHWDPKSRLTEDWDLCLRLGASGDLAFVNRVVLLYRLHDGMTSSQVHRYDRLQSRLRTRWRLFRRHRHDPRLLGLAVVAWRTELRDTAIERWHDCTRHLRRVQLRDAARCGVMLGVWLLLLSLAGCYRASLSLSGRR